MKISRNDPENAYHILRNWPQAKLRRGGGNNTADRALAMHAADRGQSSHAIRLPSTVHCGPPKKKLQEMKHGLAGIDAKLFKGKQKIKKKFN